MPEHRDPTTGLTDAEFEAALHLTAKGYTIVDFAIEPVDEGQNSEAAEHAANLAAENGRDD